MIPTPKQRLFLRHASRLDMVGGLFAFDDPFYMRTVTALIWRNWLTFGGSKGNSQYQLTSEGRRVHAFYELNGPKHRKDLGTVSSTKAEVLIKKLYPGKHNELVIGPFGSYDIDKALYLFFYGGRPLERVMVKPLALACGYDQEPERGAHGTLTYRRPGDEQGVILVQDRLDTPVLQRYQYQPLLFAEVPYESETISTPLFLDGHHRLKRAYDLGITFLYCYTLTVEEAHLCKE